MAGTSNYYSLIYTSLCEDRKSNIVKYKRFSGIHKHHIIPIHNGGTDDKNNLTYLTIREHIIAHFLLWKINSCVNDLRSMYMLGANLTPEQRMIIGKWCFKNGIGFHDASDKLKKEWRIRGVKTQIENNIGIFTNDASIRAKHASIGGKASMKSPNSKWKYWTTKEGRSQRGKMGAESLRGRKQMYIPGDKTFKRVKPENIQHHLNLGYVFGSPLKPRLKKVD